MTRKLLIQQALCLLIVFFSLASRAEKKDSLKSLLASRPSPTTAHVELLTELAGEYVQSDIDSMFFYASAALKEANQLKYEKGIADASRQMGMVYLHRHQSDKAIQAFEVTVNYFRKQANKPMQSEMLIYIGDVYYRDTKYEQSIATYKQAIALARESGAAKQQGLALIDIGGIYTEQGSYANAIDYYLQGLAVFEKEKDNRGISMTLVNIANIYSSMDNFPKALEYINKSIPITKGIKDREVIFSNMVNIGTSYEQMKDYPHALEAFENGLLLADSIGDLTWKNMCLLNLADVYFHMGLYDSAYSKYTYLLEKDGGVGDTTVLLTANAAIGSILIMRGKLKEGIALLQQILPIAQKKQIKQNIYDISYQLSNAFERLHDYPTALKYHKIYYAYHDSLNNENSNKRVQQLHFDYELGKKEQEIALLKKDSQLAESRRQEQRLIMLSLLVGVGLLIALSVVLYRGRAKEQRAKQEILLRKEEIQAQAARLEELNSFKDKTFSVLSHDLRTPMGALSSTMMLMDSGALSPEEFDMVKHELNKQLSYANALLDNLLNWSKRYFQGKITVNSEMVDIYQLGRENIHLLHDTAGDKNIRLINGSAGPVQAYCDRGQIDVVIRNLMSNAIKFTNDGGSVTVAAERKGDKVHITVSDTGVGMTQEQLNKLFVVASNNSTYGTDGEKGIGLGLLLCYEFIKANNGTISVTSEVDKGTTTTIVLPAGAA